MFQALDSYGLLRPRLAYDMFVQLMLFVCVAHKDQLTKVEYMRARHVISEIQRTLDAVEALKAGDYHKFGRLMHDSHCSLRYVHKTVLCKVTVHHSTSTQ